MTEPKPAYLPVLLTFARNSLVREMSFRFNFIAHVVTSLIWTSLQLLLYLLVFNFASEIGKGSGWTQYPYYAFLGTVWIINAMMQSTVMPSVREFSELIRTGNLDFVLLKPIDTQFLVSLQRMDWGALSNLFFGLALVVYSLIKMDYMPTYMQMLMYPVFLLCGLSIFYSLLLALATTSVWMGRNQSMDDFWFYIATFSRHPLEIYTGPLGLPLRYVFTFLVPILLVINIPARLMARPFEQADLPLIGYTVLAALVSLGVSRLVFNFALKGYRSASS